jgi:uncharacterized protein YndB with AHSA1/START domain
VELACDRRWCFDAPPSALWGAMAATADYPTWWPWLIAFDAAGLVAGARWHCAVRPPLRYTVRFAIDLQQVEPPRLVTAAVTGDITGRARIEIEAYEDRSEVRLVSALAPARRSIAWLTAVAGPIARRSHDWVLDTGARQFAARAVGR